jgi:hypothetical protein
MQSVPKVPSRLGESQILENKMWSVVSPAVLGLALARTSSNGKLQTRSLVKRWLLTLANRNCLTGMMKSGHGPQMGARNRDRFGNVTLILSYGAMELWSYSK